MHTPPPPYLSETEAPSRADVEALPGLTLLEFGTDWCGHCRRAQPLIAEALAALQFTVDRRKIQLGDPLKTLGEHVVPVKLHRDVTAQLTVKVVAAE